LRRHCAVGIAVLLEHIEIDAGDLLRLVDRIENLIDASPGARELRR
jgi:hypothetical protein